MVMNVISKVGTYAYRGLKATPTLLFTENGAKELVKGIHTGLKTGTGKEAIINGLKTGGKALEASATKGGTLKAIWEGVKSVPTAVSRGWKLGGRAASIAGKSPLLGKITASLKGVSKAIPGLGNIVMAACSLPTIISAFKDEGIVGGVKEIAKEGTKLGAGAIGAAIGSAFGPIGTAVGWFAGAAIAEAFTGKSHSEKKAEEEQQLAEAQAQQQAMQEAMYQQQIPQYAYNNQNDGYYIAKNPFEQIGFNMIG